MLEPAEVLVAEVERPAWKQVEVAAGAELEV